MREQAQVTGQQTKGISQADLARLIEENNRLKAENAQIKNEKKKSLSLKVSPTTGVIVLSGLRSKFPVSMYAGEWKIVSEYMAEILKFAEANKEEIEKIEASKEK